MDSLSEEVCELRADRHEAGEQEDSEGCAQLTWGCREPMAFLTLSLSSCTSGASCPGGSLFCCTRARCRRILQERMGWVGPKTLGVSRWLYRIVAWAASVQCPAHLWVHPTDGSCSNIRSWCVWGRSLWYVWENKGQLQLVLHYYYWLVPCSTSANDLVI